MNAPYLAADVVPVHDTFYKVVNFEVFYSRFFYAGDLVQRYPYGTYSHPPPLFQVISLCPLDYLAGLAGALLRAPAPAAVQAGAWPCLERSMAWRCWRASCCS